MKKRPECGLPYSMLILNRKRIRQTCRSGRPIPIGSGLRGALDRAEAWISGVVMSDDFDTMLPMRRSHRSYKIGHCVHWIQGIRGCSAWRRWTKEHRAIRARQAPGESTSDFFARAAREDHCFTVPVQSLCAPDVPEDTGIAHQVEGFNQKDRWPTMDSNVDSNGTQFVGVRGCSATYLNGLRTVRTGRPRMPTDAENDTGGQVVAGSNPVSPTDVYAVQRLFSGITGGGSANRVQSMCRDCCARLLT